MYKKIRQNYFSDGFPATLCYFLFNQQAKNIRRFPETATTSQVTDVQNSHFLYGDELTNHLRLQSYAWNHTKFYHKKGILQPSISISTKPLTRDLG